MTREALEKKTQDDIRGLKSTNNSATANYWLKEANLENWTKKSSGVTEKRTSSIYKTHSIYKKFKCNCKVEKKE